MELSSETVAVSFKDKLKCTNHNYDTSSKEPAQFLHQNVVEATLSRSTLSQKYKFHSLKNIPKLRNVRVSELKIVEERQSELLNCSANELVNVCYAKMWRGSGSSFEERNEYCIDKELGNIYSSSFQKDLDKLQKLRLTSRYNSRKITKKADVKKWVETSENFIRVLTDIKEQKYDQGSRLNGEDITNKSVQLEDSSVMKKSPVAAEKRKNKWKNQVHFPDHVLLCAALQDGDHKEVEKIFNNNKWDLNSLIHKANCNYLHKTIANDQFHCARILIQNGVDVNRKDANGVSPLALAFRLTNFRMVALLVDSGANLSEYTKCRIAEIEKVKHLSCSVSKVFEMDV